MSRAEFNMVLTWALTWVAADGLGNKTLLALMDQVEEKYVQRIEPMSPKQHRQHKKRLREAAEPIMLLYPDREGLPTLEFLNATLVVVSDQMEASPADGRKQIWTRALELLQADVERLDPELSSYVDEGARLGTAMRGATR